MNPEFETMGPDLEQAMIEIREGAVEDAVVEAAAARVWATLAAQCHTPLQTCADFQALIPEFKAGQLPAARALLVKDHLHECVACRRVYEGRVVAMPAAQAARRMHPATRWAMAAGVVAAAGLSVWFAVDQFGHRTGRAVIQAVNGTLYEILPTGITVLAAGQELPDGVEIRTAKDSGAMLELRDGSTVELGERSSFSNTQAGSDLTIRLGRGNIIVQAARRRSGHLYVRTADCRVAVTGTVFSVSSGVKGSRVSVIAGEVHVSQDNTDKVLHPGDQAVTSPAMDPVSVKDDIGWSRNRARLVQQLESLRAGLEQIHLPQLRYSSRLLGRLPAATVFVASIPNLGDYLGQAQKVFTEKLGASPELRAWWSGNAANAAPILEQLRAASEYFGDEILVVGYVGGDGKVRLPVFFAEAKRQGFGEFLRQRKVPASVAVTERNGMVAFGASEAVAGFGPYLDGAGGGFDKTPFYARVSEGYRNGAGFLMAADLVAMAPRQTLPAGVRYFVAEEKEVEHAMETRASIGFEGARTGMAAWLAEPSPMGTLDYISPEATIVAAFVSKSPAAIVDGVVGMQNQGVASSTENAIAGLKQQTGVDLRNDFAAALGSEFSLSLDGPAIPVPSWKLVAEVYDPVKMQAALGKFAEAYSRGTVAKGNRPLRIGQEVVEGRTYYMVGGGDGSPLTEAHYTFANGYLIAAPTRQLVARALQVQTGQSSIRHSTAFVALLPRDHYNNFSALMYQNLGTTLAPIAGLLGGFVPQGKGGPEAANMLRSLSNMKSSLVAAYGEPDRIAVATNGNLMGVGLTTLLTGNLQNAIPFMHFAGTRERAPAFH
jgi:hypothetical protein